ncbi:SusC/RagA family TonB-linked outer membrane protein [Parabacteroides sp. ASD2025]|uniref:SusC/RagA family TonB-linked outer membrane protein n=1 Tax=Parabacteroides sp. ASD2025 TaxID=3415987 RepID=UPI00261A403A|nr:TonB-dependent receptor [uncultured Parabacteroides sp.]
MKKRNLLQRFCLILILLGLFVTQSFAQGLKVTGIVKDQSGEPLIGVNVMERGTTNGSITDVDGKYSVSVKGNKSVLVFSYIGYVSQEIPVAGKQSVNVTLKEDTEELEEVVVIGYGTAKKKDLTGAISTVKAENLEKETPRSVQDLLRANAPGLSIGASVNADGSADVQIRGKNTLSAGSGPLYVLDGVIFNGSLTDINPMDIQSVDVLKDASSVAVYGAKAANGVIAITTKKGKTGKPVVNFNANMGWVQANSIPKVVDGAGFVKFRQEYAKGLLSKDELAAKKGMYDDPRTLGSLGVDPLTWYNYDQGTPVSTLPSEEQMLTTWLGRLNFKNIEVEHYLNGVETDWTDLVFQTGFQQDYTASVSNRKDDFSYFWSMGYADREGVKTGDRFKTFRTRLNLESNVTDFLTIGLNSSFGTKDRGAMSADVGQRMNNSPYTTNDIDDLDSPYRMYPSGDNNTKNPFFDNLYRDRKKMEHVLNANIYAIVKLPFGFEYQMNFNPYYKWYEYYNHESAKHPEWAGDGGRSERTTEKTFNWLLDNIFRWKHNFGDHKVEATFLVNAEKGQWWQTVAKSSQFTPSDILGYHNIGAGTVPVVSSNDTYKTGDALMGRLFYSYKDKYMLTASVRRDGYSAFGQLNPRATFPAVALGWVFTSEDFMESASSWLNYGKLRLSWGQNGNRDIGQYDALASLKSSLHPYIDQNGNLYVTSQIYVDRMANKDLKWERTASYNIGLDFSLLNDRLRGSMETYMTETTDLLVNRALPSILGFSSVKANLGKLANKGFELSLNGDIIRTNDFTWTSSGSFSFNRRKLKSLYGDMEDILDENGNVVGQKEKDDPQNKWFIGHDPDQIWDYEFGGVWQLGQEEEAAKYGCKPGDFRYIDQDGNGVLDNDDRTFQGYMTPRFYWTWRNEFNYKDFSLSFMLYSHVGHYDYYNHASNSGGMFDRFTTYDQPRWTPENPLNDYGRIGSYNFASYYKKKTFLRMDNITLSYGVPKDFLKRLKVQNMRISVSARNPFTLTGWDYFDVEATKKNRDDAAYGMRSYNISVNFTL